MRPGGIILLGGKSKRMGADKYLLPFFNFTLVEVLIRELEKVTEEVILITNEPEKLAFLPHKKFTDIFQEPSALSGLHSGLVYSNYEINFVLACDLPLFDARMVAFFAGHMSEKIYAVVPETAEGFEPLCALYSKKCLPEISKMLSEGNYALQSLYHRIPAITLPQAAVEVGTHHDVFYNMNTPEEYDEALIKFTRIQKKS